MCVRSSNEKPLSRRARLAQLCSYLQERYKHLCRQDRAATRHSRYRYAFRKALLHAASKDPECTAQLIQKLSKSSQTSAWCVEQGLPSVNMCTAISGLCVLILIRAARHWKKTYIAKLYFSTIIYVAIIKVSLTDLKLYLKRINNHRIIGMIL